LKQRRKRGGLTILSTRGSSKRKRWRKHLFFNRWRRSNRLRFKSKKKNLGSQAIPKKVSQKKQRITTGWRNGAM
jgi:hypothetical protein